MQYNEKNTIREIEISDIPYKRHKYNMLTLNILFPGHCSLLMTRDKPRKCDLYTKQHQKNPFYVVFSAIGVIEDFSCARMKK